MAQMPLLMSPLNGVIEILTDGEIIIPKVQNKLMIFQITQPNGVTPMKMGGEITGHTEPLK